MEKLEKLSDDEKKVFHTLLSHEDRGIFKNYSSQKIIKICKDLSRGLDFDFLKISLFCEKINKDKKLRHHDLHPRNIMKTHEGDFKLIDLDRLTIITP